MFGIVPPYLLEAIARNGEPEERLVAERALAHDTHLRARRREQSGGPQQGAPAAPHENRDIFTARNSAGLPGSELRAEGAKPSGDAAADEAYDGLGATFDLYWNAFHRNSLDDNGLDLTATVHYERDYDNAFWNGEQMVFGDGDGRFFNRFTIAVDVIGHELTHGVTQFTAALEYHDQPGALNESISDVFGSLVKQYASEPKQTAADADWLIGAGLFTKAVQGVALRSMKAPGTAYDDPKLGKDPQPADMQAYVEGTADSGGVHINSGIPNRAFYLAATALGGFAWEQAGRVWYETLLDRRLGSKPQFADFAALTASTAERLFGAAERKAVADAWSTVGV
jgi:Zn-dependent metalloprotease